MISILFNSDAVHEVLWYFKYCLLSYAKTDKNFHSQWRCSVHSKNLYNSRIVLCKVGILTFLHNVGILTMRNTVPELLLLEVRIGTKWEYLFYFCYCTKLELEQSWNIIVCRFFQVILYIKQEVHQSILNKHKTNAYRIFCKKDLLEIQHPKSENIRPCFIESVHQR